MQVPCLREHASLIKNPDQKKKGSAKLERQLMHESRKGS